MTATVHATPNTGYHFVRWSENGSEVSTDSEYTFSVTSGRTLIAEFAANTYTVEYNANGGTGTTGSSSHTYGVSKALTPNGFTRMGYAFAGWAKSAGGTVAYTDKQSVVNLSAEDGAAVTLYAKWTTNAYTITAISNNTAYGSVSGGGAYNKGASVTLTATPKTNCRFVCWKKGSTQVSANPTYTFTASENAAYTAEFVSNDQIVNGKLKRTYYNDDGSIKRIEEYFGADDTSGLYRVHYFEGGIRKSYRVFYKSGKLSNIIELYSNGKAKKVNYFNTSGVRTSYKLYDTATRMTHYVECYPDGSASKVNYFNVSTGIRTSFKLYDTTGSMTNYAVCYSDGVKAKKMNYYNVSTGIRKAYKTYRTDGTLSCYVKCDSKGKPIVATYYDTKGNVIKVVRY
jgi:uncharacterized repeat protein (TIGR02543 family)